jgi:sugar lactone lactonase YvrE
MTGGPPTDEPVGQLELVATFPGAMPTGVAVSRAGRIFLNFPLWGDEVPATVAELRDGIAVPYPDARWNRPSGDDDENAFVSVQSVVIDPLDRLWVVDTGSPEFRPTRPGGPKLVRVDLGSDSVAETITFPADVVLETSYLNDARFDLRRGQAGMAFLTDSSGSGANGIVVADLGSGTSWRRLHDHPSTKAEPPERFLPMVEGRPFMVRPTAGPPKPVTYGSDGIAISADGSRLFYCPLASRRLYSVSVDALVDRTMDDDRVAETVVDEGDKGTGADGLEADDAGRIYVTAWEHDAILRRWPDGRYETLVHDPRLLWPESMSVTSDMHLYVTANQFHRSGLYQGGEDLRRKPYGLFRTPIDAGPVLLVNS